MGMMMNLTLEELNKLAQMLDLATKAGGLAVAQEALPLFTKLQQMAQSLQSANAESAAD
jgi:hypothetical protein